MHKTIHPTHIITVEIQHYDHPDIPAEEKYVAWIKEPEYRGCVESAGSIADCMMQLAKSLKVLELYRLNNKKE